MFWIPACATRTFVTTNGICIPDNRHHLRLVVRNGLESNEASPTSRAHRCCNPTQTPACRRHYRPAHINVHCISPSLVFDFHYHVLCFCFGRHGKKQIDSCLRGRFVLRLSNGDADAHKTQHVSRGGGKKVAVM